MPGQGVSPGWVAGRGDALHPSGPATDAATATDARRSDGKQRPVVADALALEPRGAAIGSMLDRERPALLPPVRCVAHVETCLADGHPTVSLENGARDDPAPIVRRQDHRSVVDEPLQCGDPLVGGRPIGEGMGEISGQLLADALDGEGDALGDERQEIARCCGGL